MGRLEWLLLRDGALLSVGFREESPNLFIPTRKLWHRGVVVIVVLFG
jgi:hypothetical protein